MRKTFALALLLFAVILPAGVRNLRIGTYNLRMQSADKGTPDSWESRRPRCAGSNLENRFDIFGVQEISDFAQAEIADDLKKDYECLFFSPYSEDGKGDKASGIIYRKSRFELVDYHYFWLGDTPDVPSYNDHRTKNGKTSRFKRGGACATFRDLQSGRLLFFMNHHGALDGEDNLAYAHVLTDMEKKYNPKSLPSFLVGDFNARAEHPSHKIHRAWWSDAADISGKRPCTFTAFETDPSKWDSSRQIDFIYYRNIAAPVRYTVNQKLYGGRCASDHFPVYADFKF